MKASREIDKLRLSMRSTFTGVGRPKLVGVSPGVAIATQQNARSAQRAEKAWLKTLSASEKRSLKPWEVLG